ncbi:ubiquitin [Halobacillus litoralis]|uniref:EsaB/YukD family protein n=1 Tax=Halobacillus litoralis TaxID=45668 RepID=UPI001CD59031|nr:EsaB/YukD family protein [Halobacillus litoralis]MCA0970752.1 ubiquitin [Halobacillus litoralis]
MYIQITIDLHHYNQDEIDLRLSDHTTISRLIDLAFQVQEIKQLPRDGGWVKVRNKRIVCNGSDTLEAGGITSGDRIEIL